MRFRRKDRLKVRASADMTPLIDVVFQLLIFFMLSATFVVQTSINIQMPEAEGTSKLEDKDITITVAFDESDPEGPGLLILGEDEEIASQEELRERLVDLIRERDNPFVLVRVDARVNFGYPVEIFGILNSLGVTNYGIAAAPEDSSEAP